MNIIEIINICEFALRTLLKMDSELENLHHNFNNSLIFPRKNQFRGPVKRISEQELSILFIDEFKRTHKDLFYSVETPTKNKYRFKGNLENFIISKKNCKSASTDLTLLKKESIKYSRILNVEFKFKSKLESIAKDIFKLIGEFESGVFIQLLKNTNRGTFCNRAASKGLFRKFYKSFEQFKKYWKNDDKFILIVFLSMNDSAMLYKEIYKSDLNNLDFIFSINQKSCKMADIKGWNFKTI